MEYIVASKLGWALNHGVGMQRAAVAEFHVLPDDRIGANLHAGAQLCSGSYYGLHMNVRGLHFRGASALFSGSRSTILHISVASHASWPPTVARPSNLQKSPRQERTLISSL